MRIKSCVQTIIFLQVYHYQPTDYCPGHSNFFVQLKHSVLVTQGNTSNHNPHHNNRHHHHHPEKQHWGNILKAFIGCRHSQ